MSLDSVTANKSPPCSSSRLSENSPPGITLREASLPHPWCHTFLPEQRLPSSLWWACLCPLLTEFPGLRERRGWEEAGIRRRQTPNSYPPPLFSQPCRGAGPPSPPHSPPPAELWTPGHREMRGEGGRVPSLLWGLTCTLKTHNPMYSLFPHRALQAPSASLFPSWPSSQL